MICEVPHKDFRICDSSSGHFLNHFRAKGACSYLLSKAASCFRLQKRSGYCQRDLRRTYGRNHIWQSHDIFKCCHVTDAQDKNDSAICKQLANKIRKNILFELNWRGKSAHGSFFSSRQHIFVSKP